MSIKALFLSYVEHQRAANDFKVAKGFNHPITVEAYDKANNLKRKILEQLDALESVQ